MSVDFEPNYMEVVKHPIILLNSDRKIIFFSNLGINNTSFNDI